MTTIVPGVLGRLLFYIHSGLDDNDAAANEGDNSAVADKEALLPGQTATFTNISSYSRGLNGLILDVTGLGDGLSADDFVFRVGTSANPLDWAPAPLPSVTLLRSGGVLGSDKVTILWPDGAIKNAWLQVTMLANARTGLTSPDVFYFGSLVGETGDNARTAIVGVMDAEAVRRTSGSVAASPSRNRYDFNHDGFVNAID